MKNAPEMPIDPSEKEEKGQLEWGQKLGRMSWKDAQVKLAEVNGNLAEGEKTWRLPTKQELHKGLGDDSSQIKLNTCFWTSRPGYAYFPDGSGGYLENYLENEDESFNYEVICVRF